MWIKAFIFGVFAAMTAFSQSPPPIEPGVSQALAQWRAERYSDVRYKLNLTLEKMSPVLKGTIEIRVHVVQESSLPLVLPLQNPQPIILDWRKLPGHEKDSTISNVTLNDQSLEMRDGGAFPIDATTKPYFIEEREHLIFGTGVKTGENVIKLDFTSPILTSGSAITRYIDKEDGSEYIYSLFVPSDASTAFPVFDQPDLKARFTLVLSTPDDWHVISNTNHAKQPLGAPPEFTQTPSGRRKYEFAETQPISTYVFAFTAGPWGQFSDLEKDYRMIHSSDAPVDTHIYVRKSQYVRFSQQNGTEVFKLTREAVKYLETYFDRKFPWPKYDLVLIPEFPFGGMEHAGATFLRESSVIFPTEPTKGDYISRANLIFHETAHQWFGDLVTMRWFDDLWLKEGFAEFMAYKTLEKVMPDANAWKVFYERNKQAAYATDSTRGTTPIYQKIDNLSSAKSAYGNIVYRKAPSFLRQAEFYLGEDKFQTAVRAFLKKHEFANAGWEGLVGEFETASGENLKDWARRWITERGAPIVRSEIWQNGGCLTQIGTLSPDDWWGMKIRAVTENGYDDKRLSEQDVVFSPPRSLTPPRSVGERIVSPRNTACFSVSHGPNSEFVFGNYKDYGYGIFLLDDKSREYVLKNIQNEKDPFLRSMMWGTLWDSVREAEMDPREYVELAIKDLPTEKDESIVASVLGRVGTAMNYYSSVPPAVAGGLTRASASLKPDSKYAKLQPPATAGGTDLRAQFEDVLLDRMQNASTLAQRITFYRAFLNNASSEKARIALKDILSGKLPINGINCEGGACDQPIKPKPLASPTPARAADQPFRWSGPIFPLYVLKTKDKFDIVTRLAILGDADAPKLLADLEKTETSDDAKRYAYAAHAAFPTAEHKAKFWNDFVNNKDISENWIEAAIGPFNSVRNADLTKPYLERALAELPNHKRTRKIFFVNNWLAAWIGGQRDEAALAIVNKFLADSPQLDNDLKLKILENVDLIERAVKIRHKYGKN